MRNSLIVRHLILEVYTGKSVCINNHIKESFIVQLTTDEYLITMKTLTITKLGRNRQKFEIFFFVNYKNLTIKKLRRNRQKFEIFFVKFQAPFSQKIINIHLYISYKAFIRSIV